MMTPKRRNPNARMSKISQTSENFNPNHPNSTPSQKPIRSPPPNSSQKSKKSTPKAPVPSKKCSQKKAKKGQIPNKEISVAEQVQDEVSELEGSSKVRKIKSSMLEEAMSSIPEPGAGRVMHLVKAFERLLSISKEEGDGNLDGKKVRVLNWVLPGLHQQPKPPRAEETEFGSCSLFSSPPEFEQECSDKSSNDCNGDRLSWEGSTSDCAKMIHGKSTNSMRRSWNKKLKATGQQPFKLRTEQRGRFKVEKFYEKVKEMFLEEEKQRIPIAQGLPWTTEYPEGLVKPFVKESTEPIDLVLHSDVRAVERADFDLYIAERMSFIEQIKAEKERLQKLEEEEEIKKLRKELVPKARPMPYFDPPSIPTKSRKPQTVPKEEPSPLIRQTKKREKMRRAPYARQTEDDVHDPM